MKKIFSLLLSLASTAAIAQHRITFQNPVILKSEEIRMPVEYLTYRLDDQANQWKITHSSVENERCSLTLSLEGRDLAVKTTKVGEHYFGNMKVQCKEFSTQFRRVIVRGIRACVESETAVDHDYCYMQVLAFRRQEDLSKTSKDLYRDDATRRNIYRIHSPEAKTLIETAGLIPDGLRPSSIDSYQVFLISMDRRGREFAIESTESTSKIPGGKSFPLSDAGKIGTQDSIQIDKSRKTLADLETILESLKSSFNGQNLEEFAESHRIRFENKNTELLTNLLPIINPAEFRVLESQAKDIEQKFLDQYTKLTANSLTPKTPTVIYNREIAPESYQLYFMTKAVAVSYRGLQMHQQTPQTKVETMEEDIIGRIFTSPDHNVEFGNSEWYHSFTACAKAKAQCNNAILKQSNASSLSCQEKEKWITSALRYCSFEVVKIRN